MSYEALTLMQWNAQRWGVGFYSFYYNTLVNSQLKLEAYLKEAPDYLKPATLAHPLAVPAGCGRRLLAAVGGGVEDARRSIRRSSPPRSPRSWRRRPIGAAICSPRRPPRWPPRRPRRRSGFGGGDDHAPAAREEDGDELMIVCAVLVRN